MSTSTTNLIITSDSSVMGSVDDLVAQTFLLCSPGLVTSTFGSNTSTTYTIPLCQVQNCINSTVDGTRYCFLVESTWTTLVVGRVTQTGLSNTGSTIFSNVVNSYFKSYRLLFQVVNNTGQLVLLGEPGSQLIPSPRLVSVDRPISNQIVIVKKKRYC